ncbi:MAG: asparagine synthase (glutamine-hydrolyzing) [Verrucomicrobia bacterium]|nr:asparagine synthase (glutamine-hydrolyzing) [Verrucomicrobiota bacterium]
MCGILVSLKVRPQDHDRFEVMRDVLGHRGPDARGLWSSADRSVLLGHQRLAIIDLNARANQPMADHSGRCRIVFNGEIYNFRSVREVLVEMGHRFETDSDTEVILEAFKAWRTDCLARLSGMFAFALYDTVEQVLFVARDRAGEKPLFMWRTADKLVFASELKAIMADPDCPRRLDLRSLEYYLTLGYVPGQRCILEGCQKLPPAHAMLVDCRTLEVRRWRYWDMPALPVDGPVDQAELLEELEILLRDSVRQQLVADVPLAILLSGGVDSSLVTALAAGATGRRIRTFTVTFGESKTHNEALFARRVAKHFGTDHTEVTGEPPGPETLATIARQVDEPLADSSLIPTYLVTRAVRRVATVAVGGDGGDELFAGYVRYRGLHGLAKLRRALPWPAARCISWLARRALPLGFPRRHYLATLDQTDAQALNSAATVFDRDQRRRLLARGAQVLLDSMASDSPDHYKDALVPGHFPALSRVTRTDFLTYLPEDILVKVDRASMLNSLEVRAPFLDPRVIEFAYGKVPDGCKLAGGRTKVLLKALGKRLLPSDIELDRKQGFCIPFDQWYRQGWRGTIEGALESLPASLFNRPYVNTLLDGLKTYMRLGERVFALVMFELWRQHYRIELP